MTRLRKISTWLKICTFSVIDAISMAGNFLSNNQIKICINSEPYLHQKSAELALNMVQIRCNKLAGTKMHKCLVEKTPQTLIRPSQIQSLLTKSRN